MILEEHSLTCCLQIESINTSLCLGLGSSRSRFRRIWEHVVYLKVIPGNNGRRVEKWIKTKNTKGRNPVKDEC